MKHIEYELKDNIERKNILLYNQNNHIIALQEKERILNDIYMSHGWKALCKYYSIRDFLLPENSKKRKIAKFIVKNLNINKIIKGVNKYFKSTKKIIYSLDLPETLSFIIEEKILIAGWCFHKSEKIEKIIIHTDNSSYECTYPIERKDVGEVYNDYPFSLNSGFNTYISFNTPGEKSLYLEVILNNRKNLKIDTDKKLNIYRIFHSLDVSIPLEGTTGEAILVSGWCFHETEKIEKITICTDNSSFECNYPMERKDVKENYEEYSFSLNSGFNAYISFDTPGEKSLYLEVILKNGKKQIIEIDKKFNIKKILYFLDLPENREGTTGETILISGWCFHETEKIEKIIVYTDNSSFECNYPIERKDVGEVYKDYTFSWNCGFNAYISFNTPGENSLYLEVIMDNAKKLKFPMEKKFNIKRFFYSLDIPKTWEVITGEKILISGWCFHETEKIEKITIHTDTSSFECNYQIERKDVREIYKDYPFSLNSGFNSYISFKNTGKQSLYLEVILNNGKKLNLDIENKFITKGFLYWLDLPDRWEGPPFKPVVFSGWCFHETEKINNIILHAGNSSYKCNYPIERKDVKECYKEYKFSSNSGFSTSVMFNKYGEEKIWLEIQLENRNSQINIKKIFNVTMEHFNPGKYKETNIKKISFLVTPFDQNSKRYRIYNLIEELTRKGIECFVFYETDVDMMNSLMDSDILVIFRAFMTHKLGHIINKFKDKHIPIIFDIDDLIFSMDFLQYFDGLNYKNDWEKKQFLFGVQQWKETLLRCDYITCTTKLLADISGKLDKKSFVIKNTINNIQYEFSKKLIEKPWYIISPETIEKLNGNMEDNKINIMKSIKNIPLSKEDIENILKKEKFTRNEIELINKHSGIKKNKAVKIGYFSGTITHNKDFLEASNGLYKILKEFPDIEFHVVGELDLEEKFSEFGKRIIRKPIMDYVEMLKYLSNMDINLAPLELNNIFTSCKSELKIFESALVLVPTVASPTDSYKQCITDGVDGFLAETQEEWFTKISLLITDPCLRKKMAEIARDNFVRKYYIKHVITDVIDIYKTIIEDYKMSGFFLNGQLPVFSIISILYGKEKEIKYYLDSFTRQTYPGTFEIILVDDHSPDNSIKIVEDYINNLKEDTYKKNVPSIRIIKNEKNSGNCISRNSGIKHATGDIIIIIDADCIVNKDFLLAHASAYTYKDCDVVIGPFNIETEGKEPFTVLTDYEHNPEKVEENAILQDTINYRSFLNCITRNFSIRKSFIDKDLFNPLFSYSKDPASGFGWEDIEMGYVLYKKGARIKYTPHAFSIHITHASAVNDDTKPVRSLLNFRRLYETHPELLYIARRWTLDTYEKILDWMAYHKNQKNEDNYYLENMFQRFIPSSFYIKSNRKLNILTYRWHCSHQYELYKLPYNFTLATGLGTGITEFWEYDKRPLPENAIFKDISSINIKNYDLAILHFDENVLSPEHTNGFIRPDWKWGDTFKWFMGNADIPKIAICHGTPQFYGQYDINYREDNLMEVMEEERKKLLNLTENIMVVVNSYQAQREWQFKNSTVIWHGFDPTEFYPATYKKGILTMFLNAMLYRPHYNGYFIFKDVFKEFPDEFMPDTLSVPEPDINYRHDNNNYAYAKFRNYIDEIRQYSIYFNPTLRSPMPRSRGEGMMCGLVPVSNNNHDVDLFIKNGVNGFYSNDPGELREYLLYLSKNPEKTRKIGMEARKTAIDIFNHDRYLKLWEDNISEILK